MIFFLLCSSVPVVCFRHPIALLSYADKRINNESVHRKEQIASTVKKFDLIYVYFWEAPKSQDVSNTDKFSISVISER